MVQNSKRDSLCGSSLQRGPRGFHSRMGTPRRPVYPTVISPEIERLGDPFLSGVAHMT